MDVASMYLFMLFLFFAGGLSVFFTKKSDKYTNYLAHGSAALGCLTAILCAFFIFAGGKCSFTLPLPESFPFGAMSVSMDGLSAYFLLVIGVAGFAVSIYAIGYSREYYGRRLQALAGWYNAFLLSMAMVVTSSHVAGFIISWEMMAITSFFLVDHEYEKASVTRASYIYLVMTHVGTVFVITAFLLLSVAAGSMDFAALPGAQVSQLSKNIIFFCVLIGFGTKAGIIPLHVWLPQAHPAAPTHVSALMSAVMIKTAIYGMCRFFLSFLGAGPAWWGWLVLGLATVSSVLGILYALMERDMKRLLAYSSIENIGIVLLGLGAGMVCMSSGQEMLAGLAWIAALYHVFNHAIFKSILFMGAGAILQSVHTRNMEQMGGLIRGMPYTAFWFLVAAAAIAALPPLNGFVSEWLILQSIFFLSVGIKGIFAQIAGGVLIALTGVTGALSAACFVKAFGIAFLAKPRSEAAQTAEEAKPAMLAAMGMLGVICVVVGVWPQCLLRILQSVLGDFSVVHAGSLFQHDWFYAAFDAGTAQGMLAVPLILFLTAAGGVVAFFLYRLHGRPAVSLRETWTCGIVPTARMEYTATGFSKPIRMVFGAILRSQRETLVDDSTVNKYFGRRLSYRVSIKDVFKDVLYRPANQWIIQMALFMKMIQTGSVQLYIGYIMVVTVVVLLCSMRW